MDNDDPCPCIPMPVHQCWQLLGFDNRLYWAVIHMAHIKEELFSRSPLFEYLTREQ